MCKISKFEQTQTKVRKLCRDCKKVLDYLAISEVITLKDLIQLVFIMVKVFVQTSLVC